MIALKSLVVYKNRPALVSALGAEKITIAVSGGDSYKVREKDVEFLHPGPCELKDLEAPAPSGNVREAWELLAEETSSGVSSQAIPLQELAELAFAVNSPGAAWAAYESLKDGLYFSGDLRAIRARPREAVEEDEKKREEKQRETGDRAAFLEKLKKLPPFNAGPRDTPAPADRRFLQDAEALALGKSDKSRLLKDLGRGETPEEAHRLLLASGAWTVWVNPHPARYGLGTDSAAVIPPSPPEEERLDLTGLAAYAIDNPWSDDPDDAVSLECLNAESPVAERRYCLWVHVADPAASIYPGSPVDIEARGRGATLFLPEGASRMIAPEALPLFALGRQTLFGQAPSGQVSTELKACPALSFKLSLNPNLSIGDLEIIPSLVKVTRLSYEEADALIADGTLAGLAGLAERNIERRLDTGAVVIDLPDVHIHVKLGENVKENRVSVEPITAYRSADMVRECMIFAGEGAARWALQRQIPFPYISQEAGELPDRRLPGLAGAWQLRRCMRPRSLSAKPAVHWGLGLDEYTQVTSPLRRYTDLLCHQQVRSVLGGQKPLGEEEILFRAAAAEAAAAVASRAERASRAHWLAVYLSDKKDSLWDAVVLDRKGNRGTVIIPALGLETQLNLRGNEEPNEEVKLSLSSVKIPEAEVFFAKA